MKLLFFLLLSTFACTAQVEMGLLPLLNKPVAGGADPLKPYLLEESFETNPGYDNTWAWTSTGTPDPDVTDMTGCSGAQALKVSLAASSGFTTNTFGEQATIYGHFKFRWNATASVTLIAILRNGTTARANIFLQTDGGLAIQHGTATSDYTVTKISADTTVHVWFKYVQGTGADGAAELSWSTTTTRPTEGNQFTSTAAGSSTTTVGRLLLGTTGSETLTMWFDDVWLDEVGYPQP